MTEQRSIRLEFKPVKDQTQRYNLQFRSEQEIRQEDGTTALSLWIEMILSQTVAEIFPDDGFRVDYCIEYGSMEKNGVACPFPGTGTSFTIDMKKNGEVVNSSFVIPFSQPSFPEEEITTGARWQRISEVMVPFEAQIPQATSSGKVSIAYEYTLQEIIEMDSLECAVISIVSPDTYLRVGPDIEQVMKSEGKVYFAYQEGKVYSFRNETESTIRTPRAEVLNRIQSTMELA